MSKSALKIAASLHHRKNRLGNGLFLAEGEKVVAEAIGAGLKCHFLFVRRSWYDRHPLIPIPEGFTGSECIWLGDSDMDRISQLSSPPPVVGVFDIRQISLPAYKPDSGSIWLYLDRIRDAGNLGTLLRIADWFGVEGVWCAPGTADPWNAKCIQASMGSVFRVPVAESDPAYCLKYLSGIPVYATTLKGTNLPAINFEGGGLLLLGNESEGLNHEWMAHCTSRISIPGYGKAESLNAAVAGGIILSWMRK